jgi:hypothetical protein
MTKELPELAVPQKTAVESAPTCAPGSSQTAPGSEVRFARWVALAANFGALIGLLLVAAQLAGEIVELLNTPAANSQLASVLRRGTVGEPLTPDEQFQFQLRSNALLRYWEDVHYQYRKGLYDAVEFSSQKEAWADSLAKSVGLPRYWCEVRKLYSPDFRSELDALLPTGKCKAA